MAKGGKQPGAGRPKGKKNAATLEKEAVLKEFKEKVLQSADVLYASQITLARGQTYLYKIEKEEVIGPKGGKSYKNKRPELVTAQSEIEDYLKGLIDDGDKDNNSDPDAVYYFLTTKDPDNRAIDSMLDRTFGKSLQSIDIDHTTKGEKITDPANIDLDKLADEVANKLKAQKL
jgi:hypothetical protein